jgi:hypothetical protein
MSTKNIKFGASHLTIKRFEIKDMCEHATIAMIAKRASGKSYLTREIMYHKKSIPAAIAISRTEKLNKFYSEFIPDSYIFSEYDSEILSKVYDRQSIMNEENKIRKNNNKSEKDDRIMIIMDDCMSNNSNTPELNAPELSVVKNLLIFR